MEVVGPEGTVALAPGAAAAAEEEAGRYRSRSGVAADSDTEGIDGFHRIWKASEHGTTKSDGEIARWIQQWVLENPAYDALGAEGEASRSFCQDFHLWLTGKPLDWTPQAAWAKYAEELGQAGAEVVSVDTDAGDATVVSIETVASDEAPEPAPAGRSLRLGVAFLKGYKYVGQRWGLAVVCAGEEWDQCQFYEVKKKYRDTKPMKVVGPIGTVALAPGAPTENEWARKGIASDSDPEGNDGYHRIWIASEHRTSKSDDEIVCWIEQWVLENPTYDVFGAKGKNSQNFCQDLHLWLTGQPLTWTPQASWAKYAGEPGSPAAQVSAAPSAEVKACTSPTKASVAGAATVKAAWEPEVASVETAITDENVVRVAAVETAAAEEAAAGGGGGAAAPACGEEPTPRGVLLGVTFLKTYKYVGSAAAAAGLDAQHWGLGVCEGDDWDQCQFYEVRGQCTDTKRMKVAGPNGTVAVAPGTPAEDERSRKGVASSSDPEGKDGYHRIWMASEHPTKKSDGEIEHWIERWVLENPAYDIFGMKGKNCQQFCQDFHRWLTGEPLDWAPQASWATMYAGEFGQVGAQVAAPSASACIMGSTVVEFGKQSVKAGAKVGAGRVAVHMGARTAVTAAATIGGLGPGLVMASLGMAGQHGGQAVAEASGVGAGDAARVGAATGLAGSTAIGAAIGGAVAGPPGALGGAAMGAVSKVVGDVVGWGVSTIQYNAGLASGETVTLAFKELRMDQRIDFDEDSVEYKTGVSAIELNGPEWWQVVSGIAWNRTLWITTTRGMGVEFDTAAGEHREFTAAGSGYHSKRWWAATDDLAAVTRIRVIVL